MSWRQSWRAPTWPLFHNFWPRVLRQEPWPSKFHLPALWKPPDFGIWFLYRAQNSKSGFSQSNQILLLTTPENTKHTVILFVGHSAKILHKHCFFSFSWGHLAPKRNWRQCLCKILAKWPTNSIVTKMLWYFLEWSIWISIRSKRDPEFAFFIFNCTSNFNIHYFCKSQ